MLKTKTLVGVAYKPPDGVFWFSTFCVFHFTYFCYFCIVNYLIITQQ